MRITYNKLIRDKIPEIIKYSGKKFKVEVMSEDDYRKALLNKLVEEAHEAKKTEPNKLVIELADLLEVVDAVIEEYDLSTNEVILIKERRREERGGFEKRLRLLWTD